jgi:hypothetical protein
MTLFGLIFETYKGQFEEEREKKEVEVRRMKTYFTT